MPDALIDGIVLLGVAVVLPLALGHARRWAFVAVAVAASIVLPTGPIAAACVAVWFVVALWCLADAVRHAIAAGPAPSVEPTIVARLAAPAVAHLAAPAFGCVAAVAFASSHGGVSLFGIGEPIVELTAVHFTYAGVGAVALAGVVARTHHIAGTAAVALTVSAPPVVALGFLVEHPVPQVGGAVLMTVGVYLVAGLQLVDVRSAHGAARPLLVVSSLAPWVPMALAVAWATSLYADVPALSIPDMVRTHGTMNAVFVVAGLFARTLQGALDTAAPSGEPVSAHPEATVP